MNTAMKLLLLITEFMLTVSRLAGGGAGEDTENLETIGVQDEKDYAFAEHLQSLDGQEARDLFLSAVADGSKSPEPFDRAMCFIKEVNDGIKLVIPANSTMKGAFMEFTLDLTKLEKKAMYLSMYLGLSGGYDDKAMMEAHFMGEQETVIECFASSASRPNYVLLDLSMTDYVTFRFYGESKDENELLIFNMDWE